MTTSRGNDLQGLRKFMSAYDCGDLSGTTHTLNPESVNPSALNLMNPAWTVLKLGYLCSQKRVRLRPPFVYNTHLRRIESALAQTPRAALTLSRKHVKPKPAPESLNLRP